LRKERQEVGGGLVARPGIKWFGLGPGAQHAIDMAILGAGGEQGAGGGLRCAWAKIQAPQG
jgi:hypothetical protein